MHAHAVIGAGYGDEGKGAATDRLAATLGPRALVVRHNGGAQAGHTVIAPDGRRHVFGHIGSGSFAGVPSYLSEYFVASPILCLRELAALASLGVQPQLYVDAGCAVTTPYDMLLNQAVEAARGAGRHGSCGVGFGETIERHGHAGFALTIADLRKPVRLRERLEAIRRDWLPARAAALGLDRLPAVAYDNALSVRFVDDCARFLAAIEVCDAGVLRGRPLIFEGAQGLGLDMDRGAFPHVTRSHTGIRNAVTLTRAAGLDALQVQYATRAYATRHGAGPLAHELPAAPAAAVRDATNRPNDWQGRLRFGWLDLDRLATDIRTDLADAGALAVTAELIVSCLDQMDEVIPHVADGGLVQVPRERCLAWYAQRLGLRAGYGAYGPGRDAVREWARAA